MVINRNHFGKYLFFLILAVSLFLRFARPDLMFLDRDAAALMFMAEKATLNGEWPLYSLVGNKGLHYGPVAIYIFKLVGLAVSKMELLPLGIFYTSNFLHLASLLFLIFAVLKSKKTDFVYLILAFMLTSPHLYMYARSAWDNPYLMVFSNIIAGLILLKNGDTRPILFPIGVFFALSLGTHLMAAPLFIVVGAFLFAYKTSLKRFYLEWFAVGAISFVLILPYLYDAYQLSVSTPHEASPPFKWFQILTGFRSVVVHWANRFTGAGLSYFLEDGQTSQFYADLFGSRFLGIVLHGAMVAVEVVFVILVVYSLVKFKEKYRQLNAKEFKLGLISVAALLTHLVFAIFTDAVSHPHYLQAVWWAPYLIVAVFVELVPCFYKNFIKNLLFFGTIVNVLTLLCFGNLISNRFGYPSFYLGPSIQEQAHAVGQFCEENKRKIIVNKNDGRPPLCYDCILWQIQHLDSCKAVDFSFSKEEGSIPRFAGDGTAKVIWQDPAKSL